MAILFRWEIRPASPDDDVMIVGMFERSQLATEGVYPPRAQTEREGGIEEWLAYDHPARRLVASFGDDVIGYVECELFIDLITERSGGGKIREAFEDVGQLGVSPGELVIIKRFLIEPTCQRLGVGRSLLRTAISEIRSFGGTPALMVIQDLRAAIALYESEGAQKLGELTGRSGATLHSYVFL